ncbi:hypothetical protein ONZ45_g18095 [Pleurotus djamor]|nr:hypothetical protein ONZ45_g18095 [Pleurotus djamor]
MDVDVAPSLPQSGASSSKRVANTTLKGRKRFKADLADLEEDVKQGVVTAGNFTLSKCRAGDDEGSIDLVIQDTSNPGVKFHINLFVSDTSDYPLSHTLFAACSSSDVPQSVQDAVESVASSSSRPVQDVLQRLLSSISSSSKRGETSHHTDESEDEGSDAMEDFEDYEDYDYDVAPKSSRKGESANTLPRISRGTYPPLTPDGTYTSEASRLGTTITFKVGLSKRYKASLEEIEQAFRTFGLIAKDEPPVVPTDFDAMDADPPEFEEDGRFTNFSLSSSLENLLNGTLLKVIQYRRKFGFGWAAAELLYSLVEKNQTLPQTIVESNLEALLAEDAQEAELAQTYDLPDDPLSNLAPSADLNLPLIAFSYLIRRLLFVSRYCVVCHNKTSAEYETLKPYVCENKLCSYQYYAYNQGPSLEYEIIHNTTVVDLLVSLAYSSAAEDSMDDPLPVGMDLLVPSPTNNYGLAYAPTPKSASANRQAPTSSLQRFDDLNKSQMRRAIVSLIDALPPITSMKKHLLQPVKPGQSKPKLKDLDPSIPAAAWSILRWCIASCTADLEQLEGESLIGNVDNSWRQFRFSVGAPDAEAKFKTAIAGAQQRNANTRAYPTLYAFHGSPLKNWHSIIRHGLWYKEIIHGRAYGNGVYLAKDGQISMSTYAQPSRSSWRNSMFYPTRCVALAEVVNIPSEFVSSNPYYVVAQTSWIMW